MHPAFAQLLALLSFQICFSFAPDDPARLLSHLSKGDAYYLAFDNANALLEYHRAYALAPDSLSTLVRIVRTYNDMGRLKLRVDSTSQTYYERAVDYAEIMMRRYPNRAESHFWLALAKGSLIRFRGIGDKIRIGKEAQEGATRALEIDPTFSHAYVLLGIFEREGAKLSWLERTFVRIIFGRALSGSLEESERFLQLALKFDRQNSYAWSELYRTRRAMGKTEQALTALQSLAAIPPTNARERQQRDEALAILSKQTSRKSD